MKFFLRSSGDPAPTKVTVLNLRYIKRSIDDLLLSNELYYSRSYLSQSTALSTVFDIPFVNNYIPEVATPS